MAKLLKSSSSTGLSQGTQPCLGWVQLFDVDCFCCHHCMSLYLLLYHSDRIGSCCTNHSVNHPWCSILASRCYLWGCLCNFHPGLTLLQMMMITMSMMFMCPSTGIPIDHEVSLITVEETAVICWGKAATRSCQQYRRSLHWIWPCLYWPANRSNVLYLWFDRSLLTGERWALTSSPFHVVISHLHSDMVPGSLDATADSALETHNWWSYHHEPSGQNDISGIALSRFCFSLLLYGVVTVDGDHSIGCLTGFHR